MCSSDLTRRGRAQLALADRSALWGKRRENRQLPTFLEWLRIRCLTRSTEWDASEAAMMRVATRVYLLRSAAAAVVAGAASIWLMQFRDAQNHRLAMQFREQVLSAKPASLAGVIRDMQPVQELVFPLLRQAQDGSLLHGQQLNSCLVLLRDTSGHEDQLKKLGELIGDASIEDIALVMSQFMQKWKSPSFLDAVWKESETVGMNQKLLPIASILCMYAPNDDRWESLEGKVAQELVRDPLTAGKWVQLLSWDNGRHIAPEIHKILLSESGSEMQQTHRLAAAQILCHLAQDPHQLKVLLRKLKPGSAEASIVSEKIRSLEQPPAPNP